MKNKFFATIIFMIISIVPLQACSFFYGQTPELSYPQMFDALWNDYNETYALFKVRGVDWDAQYENCRPLVREDNVIPDNFSLDEVCSQFIENPQKCGNNIITYGTLKSDSTIGYIHIAAFSSGQTGINQKQDWASDIDLALEELKNTRCMILDVRGNRGGLTGNVSRISGRFCAQNKTYAISRTKNGKGVVPADENLILNPSVSQDLQMMRAIELLSL